MKTIQWLLIIAVLMTPAACTYERAYVNSGEIHSKPRMTAVLPLVNLTTHPYAGRIVSDLLLTELYTGTDFDIMESSLLQEMLRQENEDLETAVERAVALKIGRKLGVDTVIYGSVTEYRYKQGVEEIPAIGINLWMLDVKSQKVIWAGSKSATGGCFFFCEDSLNRLAQNVCHDLVSTLKPEK